jgi:hypothetical protein
MLLLIADIFTGVYAQEQQIAVQNHAAPAPYVTIHLQKRNIFKSMITIFFSLLIMKKSAVG